MYLSIIEYNAIMMAIQEAKNAIAEDTFIDPYADNTPQPDGSHLYTNESLLEALNSVEQKLINKHLPR